LGCVIVSVGLVKTGNYFGRLSETVHGAYGRGGGNGKKRSAGNVRHGGILLTGIPFPGDE